MDDEPEQDALFYIEGPDEDRCVWICSSQAGEWCHNMGLADKVAEVLTEWLASIGEGESFFSGTQDE